MTDLYHYTIEFLRHNGAIVEEKNGSLEVVLPAEPAKTLQIEEYSNLVFSHEEESGTLVSFDSELFKKLPAIFGEKGRFSVVNIPSPQIRVEKIKKRITDKIIFNNAVFNVGKSEEKAISYLFAFFKYTAFSDEKREGIVSMLINEFNLSASKFEIDQLDVLTDVFSDSLGNIKKQDNRNVLNAVCIASKNLINEELEDFTQSAKRRLNRDTKRVHEYYHALIFETDQFIKKKLVQKEHKTKEMKQAISKIKAIETELNWKLSDLISKYSISIKIEPISFIRVKTVAPIFWLTIKRRKMTRLFPLSYNPILKAFDNLPCESCFNPEKVHWACDDKLHIVCSKCFAPCAKCGKSYCKVCHKNKCPKCGFAVS